MPTNAFVKAPNLLSSTVLENVLPHNHMTSTRHIDFKQLARQLIAQGEDKEEMDYWVDIYPDLPSGQQKDMLDLFKKELEELKTVGNKE